MWQKCPICEGTGKDSNNLECGICKVCLGKGIISTLSGTPPEIKENKVNESNLNKSKLILS